MASGGQSLPPYSSSKTWADVAAAAQQKPLMSPLVDGPMLNRLKANTSEFLKLDRDTVSRARIRFQTALYGKFFGKSPPFEQVKEILSSKWNELGNFQISDLPNGYLLIRCGTEEVMKRMLFEGPWAVNGIVLQLTPWQPFFEPAFTRLSTAVIWIQLHNLPVEFWDGEALESISNLFGRLFKIDEVTSSLSRSKFARLCIEVDLAKPLKQRFWIGDDDHRVFVVVLYERLPTFCYHCGLVGHGSNTCSRRSSGDMGNLSQPLGKEQASLRRQEVRDNPDIMREGMEAGGDQRPEDNLGGSDVGEELPNTVYGPWMLVSRRSGRGGSRGGAGGTGRPGARETYGRSRDSGLSLPNVSKTSSGAACVTRGGSSLRGRGGSVTVRAHGSRNISDETAPSFEGIAYIGAQDNYSTPAGLSKNGAERGKLSEARISLNTEGNVSSVTSLSPQETLPSDMAIIPVTSLPSLSPKEKGPSDISTVPSSSVSSKGKQIVHSVSLDISESPPPVLRTLNPIIEGHVEGGLSESHLMVVDRVSLALKPSPSSSSDSDEDMSGSEEETEELFDGEDHMEPEDSMMLVKFQSNHRKMALSRKNTQAQGISHKKGRVVAEGLDT